VLVSHNNVLRAETAGVTVNLNQADSAVFRPPGSGQFELRGVITRDEWIRVGTVPPAGR